MRREDIHIRDPFVYTDTERGKYYIYGTTDLTEESRTTARFSVYTSKDLIEFEGPFSIFDGEKQHFWATKDYWAAEMHHYKGSYYLFGSFKAEGRRRATQILRADSPMGPFEPISEKPQTPEEWESLDGTLWVEDGIPYLVFCHEWLQCRDGEICAVELTDDLTKVKGEPFLLFRGSENPCVRPTHNSKGELCYVTDGPFLYKENGKLHMIWSSFTKGETKGKYAVLEAEADDLHGTWTHFPSRFPFDGGHAMIFRDFSGNRIVSLHGPNVPPTERMRFISLGDSNI